MNQDITDIFTSPLTPSLIKASPLLAQLQPERGRPRNKLEGVLQHIILTNTLYRQRFAKQISELADYSYYSPIEALLELIAFFASIGETIKSMQGKSVLILGANYGMEVLLLRSFGIKAQGIEQQEALYSQALQLQAIYNETSQDHPLTENIFCHDDALAFIQTTDAKYDFVLARQLNPLAYVPDLIHAVPLLLRNQATALIQWDALFREQEALSLYAPKQHVWYNESLRALLDALYLYQYHRKKAYGRFLYIVKL